MTLVSCVSAGDHRLSLLLSQAMGSQYCRDLLALQLADWNRMQNDCYMSEERLRIFALLAGKPVRLVTLISFSVTTKCLFTTSLSDIALFCGIGVAVIRLSSQRLLPAGLETLLGCPPLVHAASNIFGV